MMKKKKILFLIHDLGQGGAEKVLVNLVNNMDCTKFDITVVSLFGGGMNEQFLASHIQLKIVFKKMIPGNSKLMKLLTPEQLHWICVKGDYDIEVSYLEGPSARIISGCRNKSTKLVSWIHSKTSSIESLADSFRNINEAKASYKRFDKIVCVSKDILLDFCNISGLKERSLVLYNTVESKKIRELAQKDVDITLSNYINIVAMGTLKEVKGYDRLLRIVRRLYENKYMFHLYILGQGPLKGKMEEFIRDNHIEHIVTLLGYQTNPYCYLSRCDLLVCSSYSEGFSTAVTEALILGVPVCTTEVSGMKELLGDSNEYGIITDNAEDALYEGIKFMLDFPQQLKAYKEKALERGKVFTTESTVKSVETMLLNL